MSTTIAMVPTVPLAVGISPSELPRTSCMKRCLRTLFVMVISVKFVLVEMERARGRRRGKLHRIAMLGRACAGCCLSGLGTYCGHHNSSGRVLVKKLHCLWHRVGIRCGRSQHDDEQAGREHGQIGSAINIEIRVPVLLWRRVHGVSPSLVQRRIGDALLMAELSALMGPSVLKRPLNVLKPRDGVRIQLSVRPLC